MGQTRVYLECLCFYRKIDYDRALRLFICLLIYSQLDRAMSKHRNRENDKKLLHESTRSRGTRCSWQAGRSRPSLTPHLLGLPCYLNSSNVKWSKQKERGPRPRCTKHPPGSSCVAFSVRSIQFNILQKKKKKKKTLWEKPWQILWIIFKRFCQNESFSWTLWLGLWENNPYSDSSVKDFNFTEGFMNQYPLIKGCDTELFSFNSSEPSREDAHLPTIPAVIRIVFQFILLNYEWMNTSKGSITKQKLINSFMLLKLCIFIEKI